MSTAIYEEEYPEGDWVAVRVQGSEVRFSCYDTIEHGIQLAIFNRDEAIAAARAILKHYGQE